MGPPFIAMGFGLVVIAAMFLAFIFYRAWRNPLIPVDSRYKLVASSLVAGMVGMALWASNRLVEAFSGVPQMGWLLFVASVLVLISCSALIGSTAIGGTKTMLAWFAVAATTWVIGISIWWYVL